jgi:hypothetical protein
MHESQSSGSRREGAVARQWLNKHIPVSTNTHVAVEDLLCGVFSVQSVSYKIQ